MKIVFKRYLAHVIVFVSGLIPSVDSLAQTGTNPVIPSSLNTIGPFCQTGANGNEVDISGIFQLSNLTGAADPFPNPPNNVQIRFFSTDGIGGLDVTVPAVYTAALPSPPGGSGWISSTIYQFPDVATCEFEIETELIVNGVVQAAFGSGSATIPNFDVDDQTGGDLALEANPAINQAPGQPFIFEVCEGEDVMAMFDDFTNFNCNNVFDDVLTSPNIFNRWRQILYNTAGGAKIPNAMVDGIQLTNAAGGDVNVDYNPLDGTTFSEFFPTPVFDGPDPDGNVREPGLTPTLVVTAPGGFGPGFPVANDEIELTLRYWNRCNPYDNNLFDGMLPGNPDDGDFFPVEFNAIIRIIDAPDPAVADDREICFGDPVPDFAVTDASVFGSTEIRWYDGNPLTGGVFLPNTANGNNSRFFPANQFPGGGVDNMAPGDYVLFVTYIIGGSQNCESEPVPVTVTVRDDLDIPTFNMVPTGLCEGNIGETLSINEVAGTNAFGGDFNFEWILPPGVTATSPLTNVNSINFDIDEGTSGMLDFTVTNRYDDVDFNGNQCEENSTITINVSPRPTATVSGGGAVCGGNPAPDIIWTFTGTPPFDFTIERPNPLTDVVVNNHLDMTFNLGGQVGFGDYQLISLVDGNGCSAIDLGGPVTVTLGGTPPVFGSFTVDPPVCDDGSGIIPPRLFIEITSASAGDDFIFQLIIDGGAPQFFPGTSNGAGIVTVILDYATDLGGLPGTFPIELVQIIDDATGCATNVGTTVDIVINPVPAEPAAVLTPVIACTPDLGTTTLDVTISEANVTVDWYDAATGGTIVAGGMGTLSLNPPATGIFFAEARNVLTGCISNVRTPLEFIEDQEPTVVEAGTVPVSCDPDFPLNASAVDNGGRGTWSVNGILYQENFSNNPVGTLPDGTMQDNDLYGWTVDISDPDIDITDPGDRFEVFNEAFSIADVDGEGIWLSSPIDITGVTDVLFQMSVNANGLPLEAADFLQVNFTVDAGPENPIVPVLSADDFDNPINISEVFTVAGTSLQIIIRGDVNAGAEEIIFDDILVRDNNSTLSFSDPNDPLATLIGVPDGTTQTLTWNVTSEFGVCPAQTDVVTIIRNPLPEVIDPMPDLCEDAFGSGLHAITVADSTALGSAIIGTAAPADRIIEYFDDPARTTGDLIANLTAETVSNTNNIIYTRVTSLDVVPNCSDTSRITFTVNPQPVSVNQSVEFCEDVQGGGLATGIDLTLLDAAVSDNQADRLVTWFADLARTDTIVDPTDTSAVDGVIFFPRVINTITGCFNDDAQVDITINPIPPDAPLLGPMVQCIGNSNQVYAVQGAPFPPGTTFIWNISPDIVIEGGATPTSSSAILAFPVVPNPDPLTLSDTLDIFVTRISPEGCVGNEDTLRVAVTEEPGNSQIMTLAGDICEGDLNIDFFVNPLPGANYEWDVSNIPGASIVSLSNSNPLDPPGVNDIATISFGSMSGDLIVTPINASNPSCQGVADTLEVIVNGNPILDSNLNSTQCSDDDSGIFLSSGPFSPVVADQFNVTLDILPSGLVADPGNNITTVGVPFTNVDDQFVAFESFTNLTSSLQQVVYTVEPINSATGCTGPPEQVFFNVLPEPVLNALLDNEVCSDEPIGLQLAVAPSSPPAAAWRILSVSVPGGLIPSATNVDISTQFDTSNGDTLMLDSYTNLTNAGLIVQYMVEPISTDNCVGTPSIPINITINPEPVIAPIAAADRIYCSDDPLSNVNLTTAGTGSVAADQDEYIIADIITNGLTPSAGTPFTGGGQSFNTISFDAWTNETNATVQVIYRVIALSPITGNGSRCAGDTVDIVVDILPEPVIDNSSITPVCSQEIINVTLSSKATAIPAVSFNLIAIRDNGLVPGAGNINAASLPLAAQPDNVIQNETWTNTGNASVFVEYDLVPVSADGCIGDLETVQVLIQPEPVLDQGPFPSVCSGDDINLTLDVLATSVNAAQFNIISVTPDADLTDETIIGNTMAPVTGASDNEIAGDQWTNRSNGQRSVIYQVQPVSAQGCEGEILPIEVFIDPQPVGQDSTLSICSGETLAIDLQGIVNLNNALPSNFIWSATSEPLIGGESTTNQTTPVIDNTLTNITNGNITVTYTIIPTDNSLNCQGDPFIVSVTVFPEPRANNSTFSSAICSDTPLSIDLQATLNASGINTVPSTFEWVAVANPNVTGESTTPQTTGVIDDVITNITNLAFIQVVYEVTPTSIANGCQGDLFTITVQILPEPQFDNTTLNPVCSDQPLNHVLGVIAGSEPAASFNIISVNNPAGLPGPAVTLGPGQSQTAIFNNAWTNVTNAQQSIFYEIAPSSSMAVWGIL